MRWHLAVSIHKLSSSLFTPSKTQCMYSTEKPQTGSKEGRQESHDGPLIPLTWNVVDTHTHNFAFNNNYSQLTIMFLFTAICALLVIVAAVRLGPSGYCSSNGYTRGCPPCSVVSISPGCSQNMQPYSPLNCIEFRTIARAGRSKQPPMT